MRRLNPGAAPKNVRLALSYCIENIPDSLNKGKHVNTKPSTCGLGVGRRAQLRIVPPLMSQAARHSLRVPAT